MSDSERSYYCSQKFRLLKIDLAANTIYNCDAAAPRVVDLDWLVQNPGQLFNNPGSVEDRKLMLQNIRNSNCEQNCWPAEDKGAISPRLIRRGNIKTHTDCYQIPETIDITVNKDCNLTCSYCCKEYSSSWRNDILNNGDYKITDFPNRYQLSNKDRYMDQLGSLTIKKSSGHQLLLNEIKIYAPNLKRFFVTGGEPLLDNQLVETLVDIPFNEDIEFNIFSGLGLSMSRFQKLLNKLKIINDRYSKFVLKISAESTEEFYEFNRYGNTWKAFQEKINLLKQNNIKFIFHSTMSNLTLFNFMEFRKLYSDIDFTMDFVNHPAMLSPHVLDPSSKELIIDQLLAIKDNRYIALLIQSMQAAPSEDEKLNLKEFLLEFTARRPDLNLNIFPVTFLEWAGIKNVV